MEGGGGGGHGGGGSWGRCVMGNGSGAVHKTKEVLYSYTTDSENSQGSSSELVKNVTTTNHYMSDAQANNTHFEKTKHKGENSQ